MAGEVQQGEAEAVESPEVPATSPSETSHRDYAFYDGIASCPVRLSDSEIDDLDEETLQQWFTDCSDPQFKNTFLQHYHM